MQPDQQGGMIQTFRRSAEQIYEPLHFFAETHNIYREQLESTIFFFFSIH